LQEGFAVTSAAPLEPRGSPRHRFFDALAYEAPFLIEKLLKECIVETPEEANALFTEVKRYIVLGQLDRTRRWQMYSTRIDEAWHQFILSTGQYMAFCRRYFGAYVAHMPSNAPRTEHEPLETPAFEEFQARYEELFGAPISGLWFDARSVTTRRRIICRHRGR